MLEIFNFLKANWQLIASIILIIVSFILTLVKKKPVWNQMGQLFNCIIEHLPTYINLAESGSLTGSEKKNLVMDLVRDLLISKYNFHYFDQIASTVSDLIEAILSTPQKK